MMGLIWFSMCLLTSCIKDDILKNEANISYADAHPTTASVNNNINSRENDVIGFDADLDQKNDLSAYAATPGDKLTAMVINPGCISIVNDPVYGAKRKVMKMDVGSKETAGVTENPRAQVQTHMDYVEGQTIYVGLSVRFPKVFWTYFLTFAEFYGAPYKGTSPFRLAVQANNVVASATNSEKQINLWQEPLKAGIWYDFVYKEVLDANPDKGAVQLWVREQGETKFTEVIADTKIATITAANLIGPNYHKLACYYDRAHTYTDATKAKNVTSIQMYLTNHKIGGTFDDVAPKLIR